MELNNWPTRAEDIARWAQGDWNRKPDREQTQWMAQRLAMLEAKCARLEDSASYCVYYMLSSENIWRSMDVPFEQMCAVQAAMDAVCSATLILVKYERMITETEAQAIHANRPAQKP